MWESINAELLLFIFLPPLVFGEAMSLNWYHVKGGFFQALFLAGPGVLVGAIMVQRFVSTFALQGVSTTSLLFLN